MTKSALPLLIPAALAVLLGSACGNDPAPVPPSPPPPDPGTVALGEHALVGQEEGQADAVARTPPLTTAGGGSSFIAFSAGHASNAAGPVDNKGNPWLPFGEPVLYEGYAGRFDVKAYLVLDGRGGPNHLVSITKTGEPAGELTMPVVEVRGAGRLIDSAVNYAPHGTLLASGAVTIDGPALLVAFWWGDGGGLHHSAAPDNGFAVIEQFTDLPPGSAVQCVVAAREVEGAGTYQVTWSTSPAQGAPLWLFAFGPAD